MRRDATAGSIKLDKILRWYSRNQPAPTYFEALMKNSSDKKITPVKPASLRAQAILLNVLEELAEKDNDHSLRYQVRQRRKAEKA